METVPHNHTQKKNLYLQHLSCMLVCWFPSQGLTLAFSYCVCTESFLHSQYKDLTVQIKNFNKTLWCCKSKAFHAICSLDDILYDILMCFFEVYQIVK